MSRVGKQPVAITDKVKITQADSVLTVKGPKGALTLDIHPLVSIDIDEGAKQVKVIPRNETVKECKAIWGMTRSLLQNMVTGVVSPFERRLEVVGIGYGASLSGNTLSLSVGFAKDVKLPVPEGMEVVIPNPNMIQLKCADKQKIGHFAAVIRMTKPPEPYNGKGIKYAEEVIKRKAGKAFVGGG
ncbi:MAG: 50S ribosomal protein L6 [Planctomycetota bacterium]|nr:50S ribosomal protein L6 [Planctomycetota bacterium]MDA1141326.1 50S ribosomal protein L6 [Planctomycetota bacterium]